MNGVIQIVGKAHTVQLFGVPLVGLSEENGKKLLFTAVFVLLILAGARILRYLAKRLFGERPGRRRFWTRQGINLMAAVLLLIGLLSIWFNNPSQLTSAAAFVTAGVAVALQHVITAVAGYFLILRGKTFNVGDRIVMGGVRGDVVSLGFMQTTIMEMGQPPGEQSDAPSMWVAARQYTGRMVMVSNSKIFDEPVYNYTREFPYIWDEMRLPIPYRADRKRAEEIILEAARHHSLGTSRVGARAMEELERRYMVKAAEFEPCVFYRLTDNWVEMTVRFLAEDHGIRKMKDAMSREILEGLGQAGIEIASGTYEVVGMPELKVRMTNECDGR